MKMNSFDAHSELKNEIFFDSEDVLSQSKSEMVSLQIDIPPLYKKRLLIEENMRLTAQKKFPSLKESCIFIDNKTYYDLLLEEIDKVFERHKNLETNDDIFEYECLESLQRIVRLYTFDKITRQTLQAGKRTDKMQLNLEIPIRYEKGKTYYDMLEERILDLRQNYLSSEITPLFYDNLLTQERVEITRKMYTEIAGDDTFFSRIKTRKGINMKPLEDVLHIRKGHAIPRFDIDSKILTAKEQKENIRSIVKETLFTPFILENISPDRFIDGIPIRAFIETHMIENNYDLVLAIAEYYNLNPEIFFMIFYHESRFNPLALSSTYAAGLAQGTSRYFYNASQESRINPFNPVESIIRTGKFIDSLIQQLRHIKKRTPLLKEVLSAYSSAGFRYYNDEYVRSVIKNYATFLKLLKEIDEEKSNSLKTIPRFAR